MGDSVSLQNEPVFDPLGRKMTFPLVCVHTRSEAHLDSYAMLSGGGGRWRWPLTYLEPRSRMSRSCTSSTLPLAPEWRGAGQLIRRIT
jgi:hypothetical protein